jgi:thiamine biosynthesis lipoprotein
MKRLPPLAVLLLVLTACSAPAAAEDSRTEEVLGTACSIRILDGGQKGALDAAFARLREIEARISVRREDSEVSAINRQAGLAPVKVGPDTLKVLGKALEYARMTDGAFDPTVGPLVRLWAIGTDDERLPSPAEIKEALPLVGYRDVRIDAAAGTVFLARKGMRLDLGSVTKGFAADEVRSILLANKVKAAVIDLGGNVLLVGKKKDGSPWRIGVQDPDQPRNEYLGIVAGPEMTVVTSGDYERYFELDGKRYHHILDTTTGYPVDKDLRSVTVIAPSSIEGDGRTTSLFALGRARGMALADTWKDIGVVMVDRDRRVWLNAKARELFTLSKGSSYRLAE